MISSTAKEIGTLSKRIFEMEQKLNNYIDMKNNQMTDTINEGQDAICESSTDIDSRLSVVENALCDITKE